MPALREVSCGEGEGMNGSDLIPSALDQTKLQAQYDKACADLDTQLQRSNFLTKYIASKILTSPHKDKIETWLDKVTAFLWRRL
jgi:hypothetical protein